MLSTGRLDQGLALLDEALAAAATAGKVRAPEAVGQIYCALLAGWSAQWTSSEPSSGAGWRSRS